MGVAALGHHFDLFLTSARSMMVVRVTFGGGRRILFGVWGAFLALSGGFFAAVVDVKCVKYV